MRFICRTVKLEPCRYLYLHGWNLRFLVHTTLQLLWVSWYTPLPSLHTSRISLHMPLTSLHASLTNLYIPLTSLHIHLPSLHTSLISLHMPLISFHASLTSLYAQLTNLHPPLTSLHTPLTASEIKNFNVLHMSLASHKWCPWMYMNFCFEIPAILNISGHFKRSNFTSRKRDWNLYSFKTL